MSVSLRREEMLILLLVSYLGTMGDAWLVFSLNGIASFDIGFLISSACF